MIIIISGVIINIFITIIILLLSLRTNVIALYHYDNHLDYNCYQYHLYREDCRCEHKREETTLM